MTTNDTIEAFCHDCGVITEQILISCDDNILLNDEAVPVRLNYYTCRVCKESYKIPSIDFDPAADDWLQLGHRSNDELIAIVDILKVALNIKEMRQWLGQN